MIGMTYLDWLVADCEASEGGSTGVVEIDEMIDDFEQDFRQLCTQRQTEGQLVAVSGLAIIFVIFIISDGKKTGNKSKRRISKSKRRPKPNRPPKPNRLLWILEPSGDTVEDLANVEFYVKQRVALGDDEQVVRQEALLWLARMKMRNEAD